MLLLIRHTGMRIGECADLVLDCLRPAAPISGLFMSPSANSKPNAWFRSIRSFVNSSSACASFDPSIRYLQMAFSSHARAQKSARPSAPRVLAPSLSFARTLQLALCRIN